MKVLLAVDGSDFTKRMLAYLAARPELLGADCDVTVVHGIAALPPRAAAFAGASLVDDFYESSAEEVFRPIRAFFAQLGRQATFLHPVGRVADTIARLAEDGRFDLVVMGSHGHGELATLTLGSVATRVLARCKVPLLLIR